MTVALPSPSLGVDVGELAAGATVAMSAPPARGLSDADAVTVAARLWSMLLTERQQLLIFDQYMRGRHARPYKPPDTTEEYRALEALSVTNVMPLIVGSVAQTLYLEGYRRSDRESNAAAWAHWQANGLDARQAQLYRASLTYGVAYMVVLPGDTAPVMRPVSPRRLIAVYDDQASDEWPLYALEAVPQLDVHGNRYERLRLYDDNYVHELREPSAHEHASGQPLVTRQPRRTHGLELCPVVRYPCELDLDGRYTGLVGPLIPRQDRLNQLTFDMNMVQSFGSFVIRTISGMTLPGMPSPEGGVGDEATARAAKLRVAADRFLVSQDPDTKFGTLAGTPLDGYITGRDQGMRDVATAGQVPPHHLLGGNAAMSAEALAATETGLQRQSDSHKHIFGESNEQSLRLSARAGGDETGYADRQAQSVWGDTSARSFAQTVDGLVKLCEGVGVDPEMLWPMIPGWTQLDVERARALREKRRADDPLAVLDEDINRQAGGREKTDTGGIPGHDPASRAPGAA